MNQLSLFTAASNNSPAAFVPYVLSEAPADILAMPDLEIEDRIRRAKAVLGWLMTHYRTSFAVSYGKYSSCVLGLALSAAAEAVARGTHVQPFVVMTASTKVENPRIEQLVSSEMAKVRAWISTHGLPGTVHLASPSLANEFAVSVFGGRALPSMAGSKRDCTTSYKIEPMGRLRRHLLGSNNLAKGQFVVQVTGVRADESVTRAANVKKRAERSDAIVNTSVDANVALAPILDWTADEVFTYLGLCANQLETTYSSFEDVLEIYRDSAGECYVGLGETAQDRPACGARTGCWCCLAVQDDRSMNNMVLQPHNAYMKPLADFRTFLANTYWDASRRSILGKTIDAEGFLMHGIDGYSPPMLKEMLSYALSIDADEAAAAGALGIAPRFQIVSLQALFAISAMWSLYGLHRPFTAFALWREIQAGKRYQIPTVPAFERFPVPSGRRVWVGAVVDNTGPFDGLRDVLTEAFGGDGCMGTREVKSGGEVLTVSDVNTAPQFTIDEEGASLFLMFEMDEHLDAWHGHASQRLADGNCAGYEYRLYARYGFLQLARGFEGRVDAILRRSTFKERSGLAAASNPNWAVRHAA